MKKVNSKITKWLLTVILTITVVSINSLSSFKKIVTSGNCTNNILLLDSSKLSNTTQKNYKKVHIVKHMMSGSDIDSIIIAKQISWANLGFGNFLITMPVGTDFRSLTPEFYLTHGSVISPKSGTQIDFCKGPVTFKVTNEKGITKDYNVMASLPLIKADDKSIQYTGRIDFTMITSPRFSAPGVYLRAKFIGTFCDIEIADDSNFNYIEVIVDNKEPLRILVENRKRIFRVANYLSKGEHTILICKDTEASIGTLTFSGFRCEGLSALTDKPTRKIECYGNSITCGGKMINELCSQGTGSNWNITNRAYMSFGAIAARELNAEWMLTSVSGIGLMHNYGGRGPTLPQVYDYVYLDKSSSLKWDFSKYIPDAITIELGTNDGVQDSTIFCREYINFIKAIRSHNPNAHIFCLTGPSTDDKVFQFLKNCITSVVDYMNNSVIPKDDKVHKLILSSHGLNGGCDGHPTAEQHKQIADELKTAIKTKLGW